MSDETHKLINQLQMKELKIGKLKLELIDARKVIDMVADHRKMPHQHTDPYTKLCCLTERANEFIKKWSADANKKL